MTLNAKYYFLKVVAFSLIAMLSSCSEDKDEEFSERTKIALRDVGNTLLLKINDSTSLIRPVLEIEPKTFQLSFSSHLSFEPSDLVSNVRQSIEAAKLPKYYRVEVIQCSDNEVAYSYQITVDEESTIIPCSGRVLPYNCYLIKVKFSKNIEVPFTRQGFFFGYVLLVVTLLILYFYKKRQAMLHDTDTVSFTVGSFKFYPEQNKLVKATDEISLSKKECELLEIFVTNTNTIVKRDELTKRVWEDHGVIVGRSLDTYVSKLRKKLQDDDSIKLTNVHGVGYKLEIS
ncbi:winged helix-turn-helix domain-containing protein [Ichthyenterobacterium sp. W332]|uniref:Winged helix-turn-helix domain-containing protein n=1 Tax=Microcosmobacter mediterraneus TaxID=3075607 RepID=A0ABU2YMC5_9FLAO|nr:winged helix-turn-helix domain-containing protein [Ichthyenterobacterium sp. W332]MDT0558839.1 winged helix-turn-helix domain-containing protein [Ichthyenterobacterium sp. W332]